MKKITLSFLCVMISFAVFSQDLVSKKGETMLPEEGDYAIGFDADPFLNYVGNFLNSGAVSPDANFVGSDLSIVGKYFQDANTAYRGRVRIGFGSERFKTLNDTNTSGLDPAYVEDIEKNSYRAITLGAGMEFRRGNTRVQGYYGGEGLIQMNGGKTTFEYGESMSSMNSESRLLEVNPGGTLGFGVRGFLGVEIFLFPKTSIGFEYGYGVGFTCTGEGETMTEVWDGKGAETVTTLTGASNTFALDTDNSGGALTINFHF